MKTLYIGTQEVQDVQNNIVTFTDGSQKEFTETNLLYLLTEEPKDLTQLQDLVVMNVVPEILAILQLHNIRKGDFQAILETIVSSFNNSFNEGIAKKFGTYQEGVHVMKSIEDITMSHILNANKDN